MPVALPIVCLLAVIIVMQWRQAVLDKAWHQGQVRVRLLLCSPSLPPGPTPASSCLPLLQGERNSMGLLLRERGMLASTNAALDEVMGTAQVRLAASPWVACLVACRTGHDTLRLSIGLPADASRLSPRNLLALPATACHHNPRSNPTHPA